MTSHILLKRAYDHASEDDGIRILVERLWPRGVSKEKLAIDHWLKDIAPTAELRRWYNHRLERWDEFQERYTTELDGNLKHVKMLQELIQGRTACFVFAARDTQHNSAVVLRDYVANFPE